MYVLRYPLNTEEADQLVQDTLIKALLEADTYAESITIKHWLMSLMKEKYNECYHAKLTAPLRIQKRKAVPMRVIHNSFKTAEGSEFLTKEALHKILLGKLDEFDADLLNHEQQFSSAPAIIKEA